MCLRSKTTHLLQPLDVTFFATMKRYWRSVLTLWKATIGRKHKTLDNSALPESLLKFYNKITENNIALKNIKSGIEKCGLYPSNLDEPKSPLPRQTLSTNANNATSSVVLEILQEIRGGNQPTEWERH